MGFKVGGVDVLELMEIAKRDPAYSDIAGEAILTVKDEKGNDQIKRWTDYFKGTGMETGLYKIMEFKPDAPFAKDAEGNSTELILPFKTQGIQICKKGWRPSKLTKLMTIEGVGASSNGSNSNWTAMYLKYENGMLKYSDTVNFASYENLGNIHIVYVEVQGGGAGGGSQRDGNNGDGGGGGGGAFVCGYLPLVENVIYRLDAGLGGTGGKLSKNDAGRDGSSSRIVRKDTNKVLCIANGGYGGHSNNDSKDDHAGGAGGVFDSEKDFSEPFYYIAHSNGGGGGYGDGQSGKPVEAKEVETYAEINKNYDYHQGGLFDSSSAGGGSGGASQFADGGKASTIFYTSYPGGVNIAHKTSSEPGSKGSGGGGGSGLLNAGSDLYPGSDGGSRFISLYY